MNNDGYSPILPLSTNKTHYDMIFDIETNIKQNFKNLLLTSPGERIMMPNFGCGIRRYLFDFEEDASFDDLSATVEDQVEAYMPFIEIEDISIDGSPLVGKNSAHVMAFTITYSVPSLGFKDSLLLTS